jgi:hypothetical protein
VHSSHLALLTCFLLPACVASASGGSADPSGNWSCTADAGGLPALATEAFTVHFVEAYTGADVGNVEVTACTDLDYTCASPVAQVMADDQGRTMLAMSGEFGGYLKISGPSIVDNYVWLTERTPADGGTTLDVVVYTPHAMAVTSTLVGMRMDPALALVRVDVHDCSDAPAAGVQVIIGSNDPVSATDYFVDGGQALSSEVGATDSSGVVLTIGVAPGAVGVAAKVDGRPIGAALGFAYAGAVTSLLVRP